MSEPFVLRPADVDQPYRRWQLIRSLVEEGDTVEVEFFDDTNGQYKITGVYLGMHHHLASHASVNNGDQNAIVVIAQTFNRRSQINSQVEPTWPGGTIADCGFVLATKNITSIENINGPVGSIEIDPERLKDAIYHAVADRIGPTGLDSTIVADIIRNYEKD